MNEEDEDMDGEDFDEDEDDEDMEMPATFSFQIVNASGAKVLHSSNLSTTRSPVTYAKKPAPVPVVAPSSTKKARR